MTKMIKIWIDDVRLPPDNTYIHFASVNQVIAALKIFKDEWIEVIDIDHDAGNFAIDGGDYIKILDWMEENNRNIPIHIHSMNPVGIENMRRIIHHNGWKEI